MRWENKKGTVELSFVGQTQDASSAVLKLLEKGMAYQNAGHLQKAEAIYQSILQEQPQHPDALHLLGVIAHLVGKHEIAVKLIENAIKVNPSMPHFYNNCGEAYRALNKNERAIFCFEKALAIKPDYAEAHNNLGIVLIVLGRLEEAIARYEQALAIKPDYAEAHTNLAVIKPGQKQISIIEKLLESPAVSEIDAMRYRFALGNLYDQAKSYDIAFRHYLQANTLKRSMIIFDSQKHSVYVDNLINVYSKSYFLENTVGGSDSELPVFIVGMPRSGTTLVEQIVSSHPQVYGAGELVFFEQIEIAINKHFEASAPYPDCMSVFTDIVADKLSAEYLNEIGFYSRNATRITDKMPGNFLRIGLIKTLFPKARIIHCQRNALDTCTSIFLNYFIKGHEFSFDLTELGRVYLDYEKIMAHWRGLFSSEIFEVQYEELVMNQEILSRQLIEYLGLEWDKKCLDFHKNKRAVMTDWKLQVRKPIYKNSIGRWKQYEKHLGPLIEALKHHI